MIITDEEIMRVMNLIAKAYIQVVGKDKWDSLTKQEQHDTIMILAKDMIEDLQRCTNEKI